MMHESKKVFPSRNDVVSVILELGRAFTPSSEFKGALKSIVKCLVKNIEAADAGVIYLYNEKKRCLVSEAAYGYPNDGIQLNLSSKEGPAGRCYLLAKTLLFSSPKAMEEVTSTLRPPQFKARTRLRKGLPRPLSIVVIPLKFLTKNPLGVIELEHYKKEHTNFSKADLRVLEQIGTCVALMIDNLKVRTDLKEQKHAYRQLFSKLLQSSEEERKRIAREIHDEVNQLLLSIKINLESVKDSLPPQLVEVRKHLENATSRINEVLDELHNLSLSLRPMALDELGLPQALDWYISNRLRGAGLSIRFDVTGGEHRRAAPAIETELFRIAQEALSNVIKHARATSVKVKLAYTASEVVLSVRDDGVGFDTDQLSEIRDEKKYLGFLGMMERAKLLGGTLQIRSARGQGTCVRVEIPISSYDWGEY